MTIHGFRLAGTSTVGIALMCAMACGDSIEIQDNPVPNGTISVAPGDTDRSDWEGVPLYEPDFEDELFPVDIHQVQIAHDSTNVYFRILTNEWAVNELWRVGAYLDTDLDPTTGYSGDFLAVGADHFFEANVVSVFAADSQSDWIWEQVQADLPFDQTDLLDKEIAIPRDAIGNPEAFDFLLFANNFCCDFGEINDVYPDEALGVGGDVFTYELSDVALDGDFDANGSLELADLDQLYAVIRLGNHDLGFDLDGDAKVNDQDLFTWIRELKKTWIGDANLDGEFSSSDLVSLFAAAQFEDDLPMNSTWATGDFNGDGEFDSSDFVVAFADGGYEKGPKPAAIAVPETSCQTFLAIGFLAILFTSRSALRETM